MYLPRRTEKKGPGGFKKEKRRMRDRKMCVTEKAFQIPVCPSTRLRMHQQPLNTALSDPGDAYVDGEFGDIWCWFMYKLAIYIFSHSVFNLRPQNGF